MNDYHIRTFTWGAGPHKVYVAGGFNNWSETATPLEMQDDGTFLVDVKLPWGDRQAYKYVIDGEWMVREDEDKEWDPSGNVNNVYQAPPKPIGTAAESLAPKGTAQPVTEDRSLDNTVPTGASTAAVAQPGVTGTQATGLTSEDKAAIAAGAALAGGAGAVGAAGVAETPATSEAKRRKNKKKNEKKKAKKKAERAAAQGLGGAAVEGDDDDEDDEDGSGSGFTGSNTPATGSAFATPSLDTSNQLGHESVPVTTQSTTQAVDPSARTFEKEIGSTGTRAPITDSAPVPTEAVKPPSTAQVDQPDRVLVAEYDAQNPSRNFDNGPSEHESADRGFHHDGAAAAGTAAVGAAAAGAAGAAYAAHHQHSSAPQASTGNPSVDAFREASHEDDVKAAQTYVEREQDGLVTKTTTVTEIVYDNGESYDSTEALVEKTRDPLADAVGGKTDVATAVDGAEITAPDGTHLGQQATVTRVADTQLVGQDGAQVGRMADVSQVTATQLQTPDGVPIAEEIDATNVEGFKSAHKETATNATGTENHESISHKAAGAVAGAAAGVAALGATAFAAVKNATGVDIAPEPAPVSIEEAKRRGIDVEHLPEVEGPSDAVSPVGTAPPEGAVNQLQEMVEGLKDTGALPAPADGTAVSSSSQAPIVPAAAAVATPIGASRSQPSEVPAAAAVPATGTAAAIGATTVPTGHEQQAPYSGGSLSPETSVNRDSTATAGAVGTGAQPQSVQGADVTQTVHGLGSQTTPAAQSVQDPATTVHGAGAGTYPAAGDETVSRSAPGQTYEPAGTAAFAQGQDVPAGASATDRTVAEPVAPTPDPTFSKTTYDPNSPTHTRTEILGVGAVGAVAGAAAAGVAAAGYGKHNESSRSNEAQRSGEAVRPNEGQYAEFTRKNEGNSREKRQAFDYEDEITGKTSGQDLTFQPQSSFNQNEHSSIPSFDGQGQGSTTAGVSAGAAPNGGKGFNGTSHNQVSNVSDDKPPVGVNNKDRSPTKGEDLEPRPPTGTYGNPTNQPEIKSEVFRAQDTDIPSQRQAAAANNRTVPAPTIIPLKGPVTVSMGESGAGGTASLFAAQDRNVLAHQKALEEAEAKGETKKNLTAEGAMAGLARPLSNTSNTKPHDPIPSKRGEPGSGFNQNPGATHEDKHPFIAREQQGQQSGEQQPQRPAYEGHGSGIAAGAVGAGPSAQSETISKSPIAAQQPSINQQPYFGSNHGVATSSLSQQTSAQTGSSSVDAAGNIRSPTGEVVGSTTNNAGREVGTEAPAPAPVSKDIAAGAAAGGLAGVVGLAAKNAAESVKTGAAGVQNNVQSGVSGVQSGVSGLQSGSTAGITGARDSVTSGVAGVNSSLQQGRDSIASSVAGVKSGVIGAIPTPTDARSKLGSGSPATHAPPAASTGSAAASTTSQGGLAPPHHDKEKRSGSFSKRFSSLGFGKRSSVASDVKDESYATGTRPASSVPTAAAAVQQPTATSTSTPAAAVQKTAVDAQGNVAQQTTVVQPATSAAAGTAGTVGRTGAPGAASGAASAGGSEFGTVGRQQGSAITSSTATRTDPSHPGAANDFLNKDPAAGSHSPQVKKKKSGFFSKLKHAFSHKN